MTSNKNELMPCRLAFEEWCKEKSLSTMTDNDAWGREKYKYEHIESMWIGWKNAWNTRHTDPGTIVIKRSELEGMQTYKLFEGSDELLVKKDDILKGRTK